MDGAGLLVRESAPERSLAQRMDALAKANEVRSGRAQLKRDVRAGRRSASSVLLRPPAEAETMKVVDLLLATPKIGRVKANAKLRVAGVSPAKSLGGVSQRQRSALLGLLAGR